MKDKPRIGCGVTQDRTVVYNANYAPSGKRIGDFERPWTVMGPDVFSMCETHREALDYATANPAQERLDAWKEKWEQER